MAEILGAIPPEPVDLDPAVPESGDTPDNQTPIEPFYMGRSNFSDDVDVDDPDDDPAP